MLKHGDHVTSIFSEYALWEEEGVNKKSTLCTLTEKPKIVNDPLNISL